MCRYVFKPSTFCRGLKYVGMASKKKTTNKWETDSRTDNDLYANYNNWKLDPVYLRDYNKKVFIKKEYPTDGTKPYVVVCACQGCRNEIGHDVDDPNFSHHCITCTCKKCVCPMRVQIGAFDSIVKAPHWDSFCGWSPSRCYNCEKHVQKQK